MYESKLAVMQGGKVAGGSSISKKVGRINKFGGLLQPLMWGEVAEALESMDERQAISLLDELEMYGPMIKNPTSWVKQAALRAAAGEPRAGKPPKQGSRPPQMPWGYGMGAPMIRGGVGDKRISRAIGVLNKEGGLAQPIDYKSVAPMLEQLGPQSAQRILEDLERKKDGVKDPTGWIKVAAQNEAKHMPSMWGVAQSFGPAAWGSPANSERVKKKVGWLNKQGTLAQPLRFDEVIGPLSMCGEYIALQLLDEIQEKGAALKNPTNWLKAAAERACSGGFKGPALGMLFRTPLGSAPGGNAISKKIGQMNKAEILTKQIMFKEVALQLQWIGEGAAMDLLKELESSASEIKDPTAWLKAACERAPHRSKGVGTAVSKRVGSINKGLRKEQQIIWRDVQGPLNKMGEELALQLLDKLESQGIDSVSNPTEWLISSSGGSL